MRAEDLNLRELLDFDPGGGVIRFGGERTLLFDAVAMGLPAPGADRDGGDGGGALHP